MPPMREMKLQELKSKTPAELVQFAEENKVENASTMRKQELLFAILKQLATQEIDIIGEGDAPRWKRARSALFLPTRLGRNRRRVLPYPDRAQSADEQRVPRVADHRRQYPGGHHWPGVRAPVAHAHRQARGGGDLPDGQRLPAVRRRAVPPARAGARTGDPGGREARRCSQTGHTRVSRGVR